MSDAEQTTQLYRYFDESDTLLYVGVSISAIGRMAQHRVGSHWFSRVRRVLVENFPTREAALEAERVAIRDERPECNVIHKPKARARDAAREDLVRRVAFRALYTTSEAARDLSMSEEHLTRIAKAGAIQFLKIGNRRYFTGWHLIEFLEALESGLDLKAALGS